ncbi:MAG: PEGA domain-containing protein [Myxococcota bacterium]
MKGLLLSALALLFLASPSQASDLDLERWLDEPGTKLVAVEFYADWCKPCVKSAPRWEALRKKYAAQGLKLVVVNITEDATHDGRCSSLPWNPDESLCDPKVGEQLGVKNLPEAFVWSWQGNLLVERGQHVDEIESIIRRYLDDNPRVQVSGLNIKGKVDRALQRRVEAALAASGKLTVVPDKEMQRRLKAVRKESHSSDKRDDQRCALGAEVSANSLLTAERFEGALSLTLADAATGCQRATASVPWKDQPIDTIVQKATYRLMEKLKRRDVQMPKGAEQRKRRRRASVGVEDVSEEAGEWIPEEEDIANVTFTSKPAGASVSLGDVVICKKTPCTRDVDPGRHRVTMTLPRHESKGVTVTLEDGQTVGWRLAPTFATLDVKSTPAGLPVSLNDEVIGNTPLMDLQVDKGKHTLAIGDRCHYTKSQKLTLPAGKHHVVDVVMKARPAGLRVQAINASGDSVRGAKVFVDGTLMGVTPKTFPVPMCSESVRVEHDEYRAAWRSELNLEEKKTSKLVADLGVLSDSYDEMERELTAQGELAQADLDRRKALGQESDESEDDDYDDTEGGDAYDDHRRDEEEPEEDDDEGADMEHLRLEGVLGLSQCLMTDLGPCTDADPGIAAQVGIFYYTSRYFGFGLAASVAQWTDVAELLQVRVLGIARATLPLHIIELTVGAGLGFARLSSEWEGSEYFGVSVPLNARMGFFAWDGVLVGIDATVNVDLYEGGTLLVSGQFGPFMEGIF